MGLFENSDNEEVKISPGNEAEVEVEEDDSERKSRGREIRERSKKTGKSSFSRDVSLEDIQEQNKRIIELLEQIKNDRSGVSETGDSQDMEGDFNGVL